jgi:hypothetical protein
MLIELKGDIQQKMAVSANIRFESLKNKIPCRSNSTKSLYFMIRKGSGMKIVSMTSTIK